jgi:hypothetical protein
MNLTPCPRCEGAAFDLHLTVRGFCDSCDDLVRDDRERAVTSITRLLDSGFITAAQGQSLVNKVMGRVPALTADRERIVIGNRYIDYDLRPTVVTGISTVSLDARERDGAAIWWSTTTGMFDGTRLATRKPA